MIAGGRSGVLVAVPLWGGGFDPVMSVAEVVHDPWDTECRPATRTAAEMARLLAGDAPVHLAGAETGKR